MPDDLRKLAEAATEPGVGPGGKTLGRHRFEAAVTPQAVPALLDERDRLLRELADGVDDRAAEGDDLRTRIERVDAAAGPLVAMFDAHPPTVEWGGGSGMASVEALDAPGVQDMLVGVLRRDLERVAQRVRHEAYPGAIPDQRHLVAADRGRMHVIGLGPTILHAHLDCWLAAHELGLVGRQEAADGD